MSLRDQLTMGERELLIILIEECGEVIQAATKILRHGPYSRSPLRPDSPCNKEHLGEEIGQLDYLIEKVQSAGLIFQEDRRLGVSSKEDNFKRWTHYQG